MNKQGSGTFQGFAPEALEFFASLSANNNREWFQEHRRVYERACREPMKRLVEELASSADVKLSRIHRDMRFARGRPPYRGYIAGGFDGNYLSLSATGVFIGAGLYKPESAVLQRYRAAVADDQTGGRLDEILGALRRKGFVVDTHERLKKVPRGYTSDHPRGELLKMKGLFAGKTYGPAPGLATPALVSELEAAVEDLRPLTTWIRAHVPLGA